jgi:hypothetical protein
MADKILFDQPLKTSFGTTDRIALGTPSSEGCDNMLISVFLNLIKTNNVIIGNFTDADLTDNILTIEHSLLTLNIVLIVYDNERKLVDINGMMKLVDDSNIQIDFGGSIVGSWFYILQYWII